MRMSSKKNGPTAERPENHLNFSNGPNQGQNWLEARPESGRDCLIYAMFEAEKRGAMCAHAGPAAQREIRISNYFAAM